MISRMSLLTWILCLCLLFSFIGYTITFIRSNVYNGLMTFTDRLLTWYYENKRELPFRSQNDPYKIWVSEIMAQQTQIVTMLPFYERWIKSFPTVEALANADIDDVLKHWEGLGYYRRARNLHAGALYLMEHHGGRLPADYKALLEIPGVGPYTASAISAIAFHLPEVTIDGNVKRVMARTLNYTDNVNTQAAYNYFETWLKHELALNQALPGDFSQALMELGALVCTPSNTTCEGCPLKDLCACYRGEVAPDIPYIPKAKKSPVHPMSAYILVKNGSIWMSTDDADGLMTGLLRLPQEPLHSKTLKEQMSLVHKFSHLTWDIKVYKKKVLHMEHLVEIPLDTLHQHTIVTAHRKILITLGYLHEG